MNRILGYSLMSIGLIGFVFFLAYSGTSIPVKELWFVLSFFTIIAGVYFYAKYKLQKQTQRKYSNNRVAEIEKLKQTGDKVLVTLDNAEVKTRRYQEEKINENIPTRIEMLDALYDSNRNYKTEEIQQTYIVYYKKYGNETYKFVSQATNRSAEELRMYIDGQKGVTLYVDRENPTNYYFELPFT